MGGIPACLPERQAGPGVGRQVPRASAALEGCSPRCPPRGLWHGLPAVLRWDLCLNHSVPQSVPNSHQSSFGGVRSAAVGHISVTSSEGLNKTAAVGGWTFSCKLPPDG